MNFQAAIPAVNEDKTLIIERQSLNRDLKVEPTHYSLMTRDRTEHSGVFMSGGTNYAYQIEAYHSQENQDGMPQKASTFLT